MKTKFAINSKVVKKGILLVLLLLIVGFFTSTIVRSYQSGHTLSRSTVLRDIEHTGEYGDHINGKKVTVGHKVTIPGTNYYEASASFYDKTIEGKQALYTDEEGEVTYKVDVPESGLYTIKVVYFPEVGGGSNIERGFKVNGEYPFSSLQNIIFQRVWTNAREIRQDSMGNDMKPPQAEVREIRSEYVRDELGFVTEPYLIYFEKGVNDLTIVSRREPMSIIEVEVASPQQLKTYEEMKDEYEAKGYKKIQGQFVDLVEGENSIKRSSPTLYPMSDRTSAYNSPADPVKIIFNAIGGDKWTVPGDWIGWEFTVPEDGLYQISMRSKQSANRGLFSSRRVYIDGEIPFAEAANARFFYNSKWNIVTLGSEDEPFYFYLTKGTHFISLEATLGDYGYSISLVQDVINDLNRIYREIIKKTTVNPDPNTDYRLDEDIPNLLEDFEKNAKILRQVANEITEISGEKSDQTAILERVALQLETFVSNKRTIQKRLKDYSNNIAALGTWVLDVREQSLTIDWIAVHTNDYDLPKANPNFFKSTWFGIKAFVMSFFFDYDKVGSVELVAGAPTIEVWFLTSDTAGREQANALRTLIDETFSSAEHNIQVDLRLVRPDVLLPATVAGRGPDIAINVANNLPVNYALRNAIYDISQFDDFEEITKRFQPSAMVPYELEGKYYALPNTQSFPVLFYREDIFNDRGWKVPQTWDELKRFVPELQRDNLEFYLPVNTILGNSVVNPIFASILYQNGGTFYRNDNKESNFDSPEAMFAFEFWTDFYTSYKFPLAASFINRFRTGEMPIGIAGYEAYNTLSVFAPEIRGKWKMTLVPGTEVTDENGNTYINRLVGASGTAVLMLKQTQKPNESWEFMKWWTSKDTQVGYARELESILGPAARHNTANVEALKDLPWTVEERNVLLQQWDLTVGVPEIAGGYYTGRNLENAFREVINKNLNPRETLAEYIIKINKEITKKREEFGLPVD